jgi:hypothetical protein
MKLYINRRTGSIDAEWNWRADYDNAARLGDTAKSWKQWSKGLSLIETVTSQDAERTNRVFPVWFGDAAEGETYADEWAAVEQDEEGQQYEITWRFLQTRGQELVDSDLPWEDESNIVRVEMK